MKTTIRMTRIASALVLGTSVFLLSACQSARVQDPAVGAARTELTALQADPLLANRAPAAIKDAETAVLEAEKPQKDAAVEAHLAYLASNKVKEARALASARYTEDQVKIVAGQRDQIQLKARTQEADRAMMQADFSKQQTADAERKTTLAEQQALAANQQTGFAEQKANDANARSQALEKELADLHAKKTERGLMLTLGDVLFATGKADLKAGAMVNFDRLVEVLKKEADRQITIEGHTDSVGSDELNMALSQKRAESVKSYLVGRGIAAERISAVGKGEALPVTSNNTASGRQKNRRVEVIIENATAVSGSTSN